MFLFTDVRDVLDKLRTSYEVEKDTLLLPRAGCEPTASCMTGGRPNRYAVTTIHNNIGEVSGDWDRGHSCWLNFFKYISYGDWDHHMGHMNKKNIVQPKNSTYSQTKKCNKNF